MGIGKFDFENGASEFAGPGYRAGSLRLALKDIVSVDDVDFVGKVAAGNFEERQDAELHLDKLVEQSQPNSGRDSNGTIWWIQKNRIVTVYTISP